MDITANLVGHATSTDVDFGAGTTQLYVFYYINPPTGSSNVVVTCSTNALIYAGAAAYSGARQTSQPDNVGITSGAVSTSYTSSLTPVADNCSIACAVRSCNTLRRSWRTEL